MKRLGSIQRLRAVAAVSVAAFHAGQWSGLNAPTAAAGVDVFFVISGFVLWAALDAAPTSPAAFLAARTVRIAPLYWLATLAVAALTLWRPQAMPIARLTPGHLLLSLLLIPHNDPAGDAFPLLASGWTLTYEAFVYLALAAALAAPPARRWRVLCAILLSAAAAGFAYPVLYPMLANPLLLEFLVGAALARLWSAGILARLDARAGWAAVAAGIAILALLQAFGLHSDFLRPFLWSGPAALIVGGAVTAEVGGRSRSSRTGGILESLGDASYAIYLCQLPVICVFSGWAHNSPLGRQPILLAGSALILAIGSGWLCHRFVEKPMGAALRRMGSAPARQGHRPAQHRLGRRLRPSEQEALSAVDADLA